MTLADAFAERIVATRYADLPDDALVYARMGLADTLGVTLAGSAEEATRIVDRIAGSEPGRSLVLGTGRRTSPLNAALVNGVAANVVDFDDCNDNLGGHPSAPVLSALLPLAEHLGSGGRDLLVAYIVGVEAETQLARAVNFHHYEKGWHPTSTLGVFGATAASSHLLGLPQAKTAMALAISTSLASGIKANFGTMTKPLHVGQCARNGLLAALLAAEGFDANRAAFEHEHGFFNVFNGPGHHEGARALDKWGSPFDIAYPGLAIKQHPCCLSAQSAIDATISLVRTHDIQADQVASIVSMTSPRRLAHTNRPDPRSALEAKLSLQYCLARAVLHRQLRIEHFEGNAHEDAAARRMMTNVHAETLREPLAGDDEGLGARVVVRTIDGRCVEATIGRPVGHEPGVPLPRALLADKFERCVERRLTNERARDVFAMIEDIENVPNINSLTSMLQLAPSKA